MKLPARRGLRCAACAARQALASEVHGAPADFNWLVVVYDSSREALGVCAPSLGYQESNAA